MTTQKVFFEDSTGIKVCGILEEPQKENKHIVIMAHGFSTHKDRSTTKNLAEELSKRNINSLRIDLYGSKETEGNFEDYTTTKAMQNILGAVKYVQQNGYEKIDLFGSSAGGLAAMNAALEFKFNRIALKAPVSDFYKTRLEKIGKEKMDEWKEKGFIVYHNDTHGDFKVKYSLMEDAKVTSMFGKANNIKCPLLILHGTADNSVNLEDSRNIIKEIPNGKLIEVEGADHKLKINGDFSKSTSMFTDWFEKGEIHA